MVYIYKMNILSCIGIVSGAFSVSTLTAYTICYLNNQPFFRPTLTDKERGLQINEYLKNVPILIVQSGGLLYFISGNIIPYNQHTWVQSMYTICLYCVYVEAFFYLYHRVVHKYGYSIIHKKHHKNIIVYPFDTFYLTEIDDFASIVCIGLPIVFIPISLLEQFIILYVYITSSYLSHSEMCWSYHSIHHRYQKYNYCILFPIFDILFGTYKTKSNRES
jgi:sterol desaturase/sphingolipid hydroxylase (fatty acid hydroxylase superfamily)